MPPTQLLLDSMSKKGPDQLSMPPGSMRENSREAKPFHKWRRYKLIAWLSTALFVTLVGGILFKPLIEGATSPYQVALVSRGPMRIVVSAGGLVQSPVYNLAFKYSSGIISEIDVQQGQKVSAGQVLARLDSSMLQSSLEEAQIAVVEARNNLRASLAHAGNTDAAINAAVAVTEASFNAALNNQSATYQQANAVVTSARTQLRTDQSNLDAINKAARAQLQAAKDQLKQGLANCQTTANASITPTPAPTPIPTPSLTPTPIITITSMPTPTLTSEDFSLDICQQAIRGDYKQSTANTRISVVTAEGQIKKDQKAFDEALANTDLSLISADGQTNVTHSQIIAAAENADKTAADAQVISAQGQFESALSQLNVAAQNLAGTTLQAPHDGIVTAINGTVGGLPGITTNIAYGALGSASGGAFIQLVDLSHITRFLLNVSETDIAKVAVGQSVTFTLKAYDNHQFTGVVEAISPNGTTTNGVTYPVIVTIDPQSIAGITVLPNMTTNATITIVDNHDTLRVPAGAVNLATTVNNLAANNAKTLVSRQEISAAMNQAYSMFAGLNRSNPGLKVHEPFPTFVIEQQSSDTYRALPVVLGLSDGSYYEVLQGLAGGEHIMTGPIAGKPAHK